MICKLCNRERKLCNSHIFPEWMYNNLYDEKHKYYILAPEIKDKPLYKQKGIREYLLCKECEDKFSVWEKYARNVLIIKDFSIPKRSNYLKLDNLNYKHLKLFFLSLIWRTHITSLKEFPFIDLGAHAENIRKMLFENNPGKSHKYGIMALIPENDSFYNNSIFYPLEKIPSNIEDKYPVYRTFFWGVLWLFVISNKANKLKHFNNQFLMEDGTFSITVDRNNFIDNLVKTRIDYLRGTGIFN